MQTHTNSITMCQVCDNILNDNNEYEGLDITNYCPNITTIPNIEGLSRLDMCNYSLVTNIPNIRRLNVLLLYNCPLITIIPNLNELTSLYIEKCPLITTIPNLKKLNILIINKSLITKIPNLNELMILRIRRCPLMSIIPNTQNLTSLIIEDCPKLYNINTKDTNQINQYLSILRITQTYKILKLYRMEKLLFYNNSLKILKKFVKKWHMKFIEEYYSPNGKGYFKALIRFESKLKLN